ncbi:MAG: hypothetical protein HYV42_04890 [Candidatus Magasanikbacteria bacterium]|nr:hypothetical protein [Candidatus Magasanikbacteria bacterium]
MSLRRRDGKVEVFLTKRSPHEAYADQWHCPGTWMRSMDAAIGDAFQRLWKREFRVPFRSPPVYCGMYFNRQEVRGQVLMLAYLVDLLEHVGGSLIGQWWPVDALPENTLAVHRDVTIPQAVAAFLAAGK